MILEELNKRCENSFVEYLGIRFTEYDGCKIGAEIEIQDHHKQPVGVVHGGVYLSFAETIAGAGSAVMVEKSGKTAFGTVVNGQHLASVRGGIIRARAELSYKGEFKHIWDVKISDADGKLISLCRVTNSIKELKVKKD